MRAVGTAAARNRLGPAIALLVSLVAIVLAGRAEGAAQGSAWSGYLAPADVCGGATDAAASSVVQRRALRCLVNWARAQDRNGRLGPSRGLQRAAGIKGRGMAECRVLSHAPCRSDVTDAVEESGYRYSFFGENLFAGTWGQVAPRDVVAAWLRSPPHRQNLLSPHFRELGSALVRAHGVIGDGDAALWVATFGSPR